MALNPLLDSRDLRFTFFELLEVDKLTSIPKYADLDRSMFEDVIDLAEKVAMEQVYSISAESEKQGVKYDPDTHRVTVPDSFKPALKAYHEAGFIGIPEDPEIGGMGMPACIAMVGTRASCGAGGGLTCSTGDQTKVMSSGTVMAVDCRLSR